MPASALRALRTRGRLTGAVRVVCTRCSVVWVDDMCDGKQALGRLVDIHSQLHIDVIVGLPCSNGLSVT